ncbi:hypothetical protein ACJJTC_015062 [Scirpophaga incertulas]
MQAGVQHASRHAACKQACSMQVGMQHASRHAACMASVTAPALWGYGGPTLAKHSEELKELGHWFEENYVCGTCSRPAKYSPEFWSSEIVSAMNVPRTQNSAEAWHHHINQIIDKKKPGFYLLIKELIKETIINESEIDKMICGSPPEKKRKKYAIKDDKIKKLIELRNDLSEVKYLKEMAKLM